MLQGCRMRHRMYGGVRGRRREPSPTRFLDISEKVATEPTLMLAFAANEQFSLNICFDDGGTFLHELVNQNHGSLALFCNYLCTHGIEKAAVNKKGQTALDKLLIRLTTADTVNIEDKRNLYVLLVVMLTHHVPSNIFNEQEAPTQLALLAQLFKFSPLVGLFKSVAQDSPWASTMRPGYTIFGFMRPKDQRSLACANKEIAEFAKPFMKKLGGGR